MTEEEVGKALVKLGNYRVKRVQTVAHQGAPDGISGSLLLALGCRETNLANIEGGARFEGGKWVKEWDPTKMDVGWTQISRRYHLAALSHMPGVEAGSWGPMIAGRTAADAGYCPRFEDSLRYTVANMHEDMGYGAAHDIAEADLPHFAVVCHNAGQGGALEGFRAGKPDLKTAGGNYSADVYAIQHHINAWLIAHPHWTP